MPSLYQIQDINSHHPYNLRNLGERTTLETRGIVVLNGKPRERRTRLVTVQDYDKEFAKRIITFSPAYQAEEFLEHHYKFTDYEPEKWLKHLEYEILTKEEFTGKNVHFKKLVKEWLAKKRKELKTNPNAKMERYYYNITNAKTKEDADWEFISPLSILCAGSEMSLPKVRPYLELQYNTYAGENRDKKIEWLEYTRDLAKRHYNYKAFSDAVLSWIEKELYKVESFTMNESNPLSTLSEATISKAKDQARNFRRFLGETQELHKSFNFVEDLLKFIPASEYSLFFNTLIQEVNKFFPEENANKLSRNFELEQQWKEVILWAESKLEGIKPDSNLGHSIANRYNIKWNDSSSNFMELIYALMESNTITFSKKEDVVKAFAEFFNYEIKNPDQVLYGVKAKRNRDNQTILLDKLKTAFQDYLNKEK